MAFRNRPVYLPLDELGIILGRVTGDLTMDKRFEWWKKIILENPARLNYAVITDMIDWSGVISENDVYTIVAWNAEFRMKNNILPGKQARLAWIGRAGSGLNLLTDMVNKIRPGHAFHTSTVQEAWQLVMPGVPMPAKAKNYFKRGLLF